MRISATPIEALLGGVSLGLLSVGRLFIHGKIFGISGNVRCALLPPSRWQGKEGFLCSSLSLPEIDWMQLQRDDPDGAAGVS